jgi:glutathione S-transferase
MGSPTPFVLLDDARSGDTAADALLYPHLAVSAGRLPGALSPYPALQAYVARVGARPGVQRGMAVLQPQNA